MAGTLAGQTGAVGRSVIRVDSRDKLRGRVRYVDDLNVPGLWHGAVVRSSVSHGKLRNLQFNPAFDWNSVVVVTPQDIPGKNVADMFEHDMPFLTEDEVRHIGEPLALIAAPTRELLSEAVASVQADIEKLPAIYTMQEVVAAYKTGDPDLYQMCEQTIRKGDMDRGFEDADQIVEGEYWTGHQEQLYLETQGMIAEPQEDGGVFIHGSMQCPYFITNELAITLDLPPEKIRVKQEMTGGAFGGKEEFPTLIAGYCALLALKGGHPVKIVYDRHEDICFTTKRHPSWIRHRTGLKNDGTITAMHVDFLLDGGAYATLSSIVLARGILHAAMGYRCDNVFVDGRVFRTNTFPSGAFRGFGAPQGIWALESQIDKLAAACGMKPHEFRLKNCLQKNDITPTGQVLTESVGSPDVLNMALARSDYASKLKKCTRGDQAASVWYGIGLAFFAHGAGFTGDGESRIKAVGAVELDLLEDGTPNVFVRVSSTEMGQGAQTVMIQIAADALSVLPENVQCPLPDTGEVPDSGPTVASRTTMVVGHTVHRAALELKSILEEFASGAFFDGSSAVLKNAVFIAGEKTMPFETVAAEYIKCNGPKRTKHTFALPADLKWNQETFEGDAYPSYSWGCNVAEVDIDPLTLEIRLSKITACFDIGRVINPIMSYGQIEGGLVQACGYALMEKMGIVDGRFDADRMQTYAIPTMLDVPPMDIEFVEHPYDYAAPGAKGVGEMPMNGVAPAISAAIEAAVGVRFTQIPMTSEMLLDALQKVKN